MSYENNPNQRESCTNLYLVIGSKIKNIFRKTSQQKANNPKPKTLETLGDFNEDEIWNTDCPSPPSINDFYWPSGQIPRNSTEYQFATGNVIGREEVQAEWERITTKLERIM